MGKIISGGKEAEVKDGESIIPACKELGIPFSCEDGVCGSCLVNIIKGAENLSPPNEKEKDFGLSGRSERLACQCKLEKGEVELESAY